MDEAGKNIKVNKGHGMWKTIQGRPDDDKMGRR